eukprot:1193537-Prorocentrum_minimum.AAC.1
MGRKLACKVVYSLGAGLRNQIRGIPIVIKYLQLSSSGACPNQHEKQHDEGRMARGTHSPAENNVTI